MDKMNLHAKLERAYCVLRIHEHIDFMEIYHKLRAMDFVVHCQAVHGEYHLLLLLESTDAADLSRQFEIIRSQLEIEEVLYLPVITPQFTEENVESVVLDAAADQNLKQGYVLIEAEEERLNELYSRLCKLSGVESCEMVSGNFNLFLRLKHTEYHGIKKILTEGIRPLAGVLRARLLMSINLYSI